MKNSTTMIWLIGWPIAAALINNMQFQSKGAAGTCFYPENVNMFLGEMGIWIMGGYATYIMRTGKGL